MRSKTSFFNFTLLWKDVRRFWPVWGGYLAIWSLLGPITLLATRHSLRDEPLRAANHMLELGYAGGVIMGAIFGVLIAMAVWSFAYRARSAHAMASLPVRREGMFLSLGLAGLLPLLAANVVTAGLSLLMELLIGCVDLPSLGQFLLLTSLPLLFYYGLATFCAQLTGNILVLPALYALLNFLVPIVELLIRAVGGQFIFGLRQDVTAFALLKFSPTIAYFRYGGVSGQYASVYHESGDFWFTEVQRAHVNGWGLMVLYACVGLVLVGLALLLFRRRRMESAGDVVAVNVLKPVFRWCMAFGCALGLGLLLFMAIYEGSYGGHWHHSQMLQLLTLVLLMFVGAFVGWFVAQMLIQKSFRVFRGHWAGYGLCCLIIAVVMFAMEFDLLGFERYVPDPAKVERVLVSSAASGGDAVLEQPENLEAVTALHRSIVSNKASHEAAGGDWTYVSLTYTLRSGRTVSRYYNLYYTPWEQDDAAALQALLNCPEAIQDRKRTRFPITADNINGGYVSAVISATEGAERDGYDSPEDWILAEAMGYSREALALLEGQERETALKEAVFYRSYNSDDFLKYHVAASPTDIEVPVEMPMVMTETRPTTAPEAIVWPGDVDGLPELSDIDLSKVLFEVSWEFSFRELADLYQNCVQPDLQDGTIGRVWILAHDDSYYREATSVSIYISAESRSPDEHGNWSGNSHISFRTTPTVDSVRTNAWLTAHGIPVRSLAETRAIAAG